MIEKEPAMAGFNGRGANTTRTIVPSKLPVWQKMRVGAIERRNGVLKIVEGFTAHARRIIVMKIVEKSVLAIDLFRKKRPILMPLIGRREKNETTPIPSPLFKIILTNRGQTDSYRMPTIENIKCQINATINFDCPRVLTSPPSAAGDIESRVV